MAVMTFETPSIQQSLAKELQRQISWRIIRQSHKSLEILQGLLVYVAWYQSFYRPKSQQLAIVLQLCVAMNQDLSLTKDPKDKARKLALLNGLHNPTERSAAEKRALLGTYFLIAA